MNTKALRQKILDLAIHGKLVPQDPNDEPASVLLERIRDEKERLIKEGKIKRPKKTKTTSDKPHYPYQLPEGWVWTTLGEITNYGDSVNVQVDDIDNTDWVLELEDIEKDSANIIQHLTKNDRKINGTRHKFQKGEILYSKLRTYLNKVLVAPNDGFCTTEIMAFGSYGILSNEYICHALRSPYFLAYTLQCGYGVKMPRLSTTDACNGLIPLPPLEEQERIVIEIQRLFSIIDIVEDGKDDLKVAIQAAKSKILDLAIHGKLVPQDPNDKPASELLKRINPKAEITCDNGHYQKLPEGWCECSFDDIFNITMGQSPNGCSINHQQGIEFHQGKILFGDKYLKQSDMFTDAPTKLATPNSLLLCVRAPVGVVNITQREICIGRGLCSLKPNAAINLDYAYHALTTYQSDFESKSTGSTFKAISGSIIRTIVR